MAPLNAMIANSAKRAAYGAAQAARVLWYTGHYAYGRRLMGPLTEPGQAPYAEEFGPLDRERHNLGRSAAIRIAGSRHRFRTLSPADQTCKLFVKSNRKIW